MPKKSAQTPKARPREVRLEYLSSPQIARYLQRSDLAILPAGCIEMHGPHVPVGCDTIHARAMSVVLAELWDCLVLPAIPYSYPGASDRWPGTIAPRPAASIAYLKEICLAAIAAGFKRLVVLATHAPLSFMLSSVIREVHQETGHIILHIAPTHLMPDDLMNKALGYTRGEDILVLASASILGLPADLVPKMEKDSPGQSFPFQSQSGLRKAQCQWPWTFSEPWQHQPVRSIVKPSDAAKAVQVMRQAAARQYADVPKLFAQYQRDMKKLYAKPPWAIEKVARM